MSKQDAFDSVMLLLTETISSEDFLTEKGIYRSKPLGKDAWDKLVRKVNRQDPKTKVGIYPKSFTRGEVHYFAIRQDPGEITVANGYPDAGGFGFKHGRALNAQPEKSHGLCQTFALMYYTRYEHLLKPGKYQTNVIIGLEWLKTHFFQDYPWVMTYDENIVSFVQIDDTGANAARNSTTNLKTLLGSRWPKSKIYIEDGKSFVSMHELVDWLLAPTRRGLLNAWAKDLGKDL